MKDIYEMIENIDSADVDEIRAQNESLEGQIKCLRMLLRMGKARIKTAKAKAAKGEVTA